MKHGKNPTVKQREKIESHGLKPQEWLVVKNKPRCLEIVHRGTGKTHILWRGVS